MGKTSIREVLDEWFWPRVILPRGSWMIRL
jgi:hypothetical protein